MARCFYCVLAFHGMQSNPRSYCCSGPNQGSRSQWPIACCQVSEGMTAINCYVTAWSLKKYLSTVQAISPQCFEVSVVVWMASLTIILMTLKSMYTTALVSFSTHGVVLVRENPYSPPECRDPGSLQRTEQHRVRFWDLRRVRTNGEPADDPGYPGKAWVVTNGCQ